MRLAQLTGLQSLIEPALHVQGFAQDHRTCRQEPRLPHRLKCFDAGPHQGFGCLRVPGEVLYQCRRMSGREV